MQEIAFLILGWNVTVVELVVHKKFFRYYVLGSLIHICLSANIPASFLILVLSEPFEWDPSGFLDTGLPNSKFVN